MSTEINKPYQPFTAIPKATGLQEHVDPIQTHKMIREANERNNGLQNITSIEDPPWYRSPSQEFQGGKRAKIFNYSLDTKFVKNNQRRPPIQTAKQRYNGLQDFDEIFPKNINPPDKNKKPQSHEDNVDVSNSTETKNVHQDNNKIDLRKQVRQTLNGVPVTSRLNIVKSQTSVSSKCPQQEEDKKAAEACKNELPRNESQTSVSSKKTVETAKSCKGEISRNESQTSLKSKCSQTSVLSKCSQKTKKVETPESCKGQVSRNESKTSILSKSPNVKKVEACNKVKTPDKSSNQEDTEKLPNNSPKDQKNKATVKKSLKEKK